MEQKDYMLREIEKTGAIVRMIASKVAGSAHRKGATAEVLYRQTAEDLLYYLEFDLGAFIQKNDDQVVEYIEKIKGFDIENLLMLSTLLEKIAVKQECNTKLALLHKVLLILEHIKVIDEANSADHEQRIALIKEHIKKSEPHR